ncbi:MAG: DUF2149 domain-containing protein [Methanobacteriota archaeon]|jgi:hypothetical protein
MKFLRKRRPRIEEQESPMEGVANLFDVALVFAVALMLALVTYASIPEMLTQTNVTIVKNPGTPQMEIITKQGEKIEVSKISEEIASGRGKKIGSTYILENGEAVYVPE